MERKLVNLSLVEMFENKLRRKPCFGYSHRIVEMLCSLTIRETFSSPYTTFCFNDMQNVVIQDVKLK